MYLQRARNYMAPLHWSTFKEKEWPITQSYTSFCSQFPDFPSDSKLARSQSPRWSNAPLRSLRNYHNSRFVSLLHLTSVFAPLSPLTENCQTILLRTNRTNLPSRLSYYEYCINAFGFLSWFNLLHLVLCLSKLFLEHTLVLFGFH